LRGNSPTAVDGFRFPFVSSRYRVPRMKSWPGLEPLLLQTVSDPLRLIISVLVIFSIAVTKGAFGGGFAILGVPLLSLVLTPVEAGGLLAPLLVLMDACALRYWTPTSWSKTDVGMLVPALLVGVCAGYFTLRNLDPHGIAIVIGGVTLGFVVFALCRGDAPARRERSRVRAWAAGSTSGLATMVAHSGGPPISMYLLSLGLPKEAYVSTSGIVFAVANMAKLVPWLLLAQPSYALWALTALCSLAVPVGLWSGWLLHRRLEQRVLFRVCYALLAITGLKLLWDGLEGRR
jgi:uncharacterized protein